MAETDDETTASDRDLLLRIARELKTLREGMGKALFAIANAESEIPEKMRRFANYYHDVVHIKSEYIVLGIPAPKWVDAEMERCHDRFRQVLEESHGEDGAFAKVRRDMAEDPNNRYDHTRLLDKPRAKELGDETE